MMTMQISELEIALRSCQRFISEAWYRANPLTESIGQLFHDESVITQLQSLQTFPIEDCRIFAGRGSDSLLSELNDLICNLVKRSINLLIAIPHTQQFVDGLSEGLRLLDRDCIFQSKLKNESYLIIDNNLIIMIQHQAIGDICTISDDTDLLRKVNNLWKDAQYRLDLHRILRFE